jgi:hypothetical protein
MAMRNPERAIATLTGEMHALFMAVQALAKTHPNPIAALSEFDAAAQLGLAALEPHPIPNAVIAGYQDTVAGIRGAFAANPLYSHGSHS